jgi:hypothetical protein
VRSICSATSARLAHRIVGALRATSDAIVVPHEPLPTTATHACLLIGSSLEYHD